jgi:hypothetical protein
MLTAPCLVPAVSLQNNVQAGLTLIDHDYTLIDPEHKEDPDLIDKITSNVTVTNNRFRNGYEPATESPFVAQLYGDIVYAVAGQQDNCFAGNKYKLASLLTLNANGMPDVKHLKPAQFNTLFPCA